MLILIIALTSLSWQPSTSEDCDVELSKHDTALSNHVIKLIENVNYGRCMMECSMHPKCHSFNRYLDTNHCELNNATHMSHPDDMNHRPHGNYMLYPVRPLYICNYTLCGTDKICNVNRDGASYTCVKALECSDYYNAGVRTNGVYTIDPDGGGDFNVYCDMTTDGGGWTVFQRRQDGSVDFYLDWNQYKTGFGNLTGEFWLGNDYIHRLTTRASTLRVELEDWVGVVKYAKYGLFAVSDEASNYTLTVGSYSGTLGDMLTYYHGNMQFSTKDRDNDLKVNGHCAVEFTGAWWYKDCQEANLNGQYLGNVQDFKGIYWWSFKNLEKSLKFSEMKLRAKP